MPSETNRALALYLRNESRVPLTLRYWVKQSALQNLALCMYDIKELIFVASHSEQVTRLSLKIKKIKMQKQTDLFFRRLTLSLLR